MRPVLLLKILLAATCIYITFRTLYVNASVQNAISTQVDSLGKLKNDPAKDSAENRRIYQQKKASINKEIDRLEQKQHKAWWAKLVVPVLTLVCVLLAADIGRSIREKKKV